MEIYKWTWNGKIIWTKLELNLIDSAVHNGITLMDAGLMSVVANTDPWTTWNYKGYRNDTPNRKYIFI